MKKFLPLSVLKCHSLPSVAVHSPPAPLRPLPLPLSHLPLSPWVPVNSGINGAVSPLSLSVTPSRCPPDDVELRLVQKGGIGGVVVVSDCEGTAEVRYNGTWGMACGDSWNMAVAQVACRHLGCGFVRTFQRVERSSAVREQAQLTHVHCLGTEQLLWKCQSLSWGDGACYSGFRVDIACS
eukprot:g29569.t1